MEKNVKRLLFLLYILVVALVVMAQDITGEIVDNEGKVCPMNVEVCNDSRQRKNATECILCQSCTKACPVKALKC